MDTFNTWEEARAHVGRRGTVIAVSDGERLIFVATRGRGMTVQSWLADPDDRLPRGIAQFGPRSTR